MHELIPVLHIGSKDILMPGMVHSVEPGIYGPKIGGIRIEDDILSPIRAQIPFELPKDAGIDAEYSCFFDLRSLVRGFSNPSEEVQSPFARVELSVPLGGEFPPQRRESAHPPW
jgi:hypothetical protein